ncbi:MAG: DUF433 domain-containing protein [Phycisphaerales bacterium]|nr:DUF433 domain-containing protein [Phycisphaerales bacterium]
MPLHMLFDHLRAGSTIDDFVADFPPVTREQAAAVIELAQTGMLEGLRRL